jgi:glycosyltransferase involved in cell wall biosynthesis
MKALLYNTRSGFREKSGGDTTQMLETHRELVRLGVTAEIAQSEPQDLNTYDLLHVFNLQTIEGGLRVLRLARNQRKAVVLSPVYWDLRPAGRSLDSLRFLGTRLIRSVAAINPSLAVQTARLRHIRRYFRQRRIQGWALTQADLLLPNSVAELEILVADFNGPAFRGKAWIVPNGVTHECVDDSEPMDHVDPLPAQFVLQAASYHPIKGQARLIKALMNERTIPIVCVGRCDSTQRRYFDYCRELAKQRGATVLLNEVEHEKMPWLYSRAKVHALPSLRESPGLASLEAAVYGANCVVGIHAPVTEYFGMDAFVCDPEDLSSLRDAVLRAWMSPSNGILKTRILRDFTWRHAAEETLRGYQWVLAKQREATPRWV